MRNIVKAGFFRPLCHKLIPVFAWCIFLSFLTGHAQIYKAVNISLPEGLSQSSVYALAQDETGFIWAATQDGLNKFDGLNFTTYYNKPFDSTSISSAFISALLFDSKGRKWIGTANNGLNLKTGTGDKFIRFNSARDSLPDNSIKSLYEDSYGNIFVATICDVCIIRQNNNSDNSYYFENLTADKNIIAPEVITSLFEEDSSSIWIGTKTTLYLYRYRGNEKTVLAKFNRENGYTGYSVMSMLRDDNGNLWAASATGITVISKQRKIMHDICFNPCMKGDFGVQAMCRDSKGNFWAATSDGVYLISSEDILNIADKKPVPQRILPTERVLSTGLLSIREDRINKGLMWIGSESNGLIKLVPLTKKFKTNHMESELKTAFVFSILKDYRDKIWIGTTAGFFRYDRSLDKYVTFKSEVSDPKTLPYDFVNSICQTDDKKIFVGTPLGFAKVINPESDKPQFKRIQVNPRLPQAPVRHLVKQDHKIYIVLPMRVYRFDPVTEKSSEVLAIEDDILKKHSVFALSCMKFDASNNIWLGSSNGLFFYRLKSDGTYEKPEVFYHNQEDTTSLRSQTINEISVADNGSIWICTSNGLSKVVKEENQIRFDNFSTDDGLKNNAVYGALENPKDHSLWLSTNGGLSCFYPSQRKFINYDLHDGLQSNEFNGGSYFRAADNEFFFGGVNGYTSFYPDEILPDTQPPLIYITSFSLGDSIIKIDPLADKQIKLKHNQNSFSINFIALHYVNPIKNTYEYMLEGYQNGWTRSGNINRVNFSQLPPGNYVFRVKGSNNDGISNAQSDALRIVIKPPFWQTVWFYAAVAAFILIAFWLVHLYRLRMKVNQMKEIEKIRKEIAADFHDELGHKVTTISWFSEILQNRLNPEEKDQRAFLSKIMDTSGSLYHTMKDLLWAMDPSKDSVADLYFQIKEFGESLFDQTGVEFTAGMPPDELNQKNIPLAHKRHILLIFKEAMHNSFKHSKGSKVSLNVLRENNHVTICLDDNGRGFTTSADMLGYGLKNVEKRTKEINGKIKIASGASGTSVRLEVPFEN